MKAGTWISIYSTSLLLYIYSTNPQVHTTMSVRFYECPCPRSWLPYYMKCLCNQLLGQGQNPRFLHFGNGIRCMYLTLKGIVEICPRLITKRHYILSLKKKSPVIFFQTDDQPTVGTNITGNHNTRQPDSLYILVE